MMATFSASRPWFGKSPLFSNTSETTTIHRSWNPYKRWVILAGVILFSWLAVAQNAPQVSGVDPASGKVSDTVTVSGSNLGKASVSSVFLSDDKNDYKATIVEQNDD